MKEMPGAAATAGGVGQIPVPTVLPLPSPRDPQQKQHKKNPLRSVSRNGDTSPATNTSGRETPLTQEMFVLCLPLDPEMTPPDLQLPALPLPYFKLQRGTQVAHLRRILVGALGLIGDVDPDLIEFLCQGEVLTGQHSLYFIDRTKWRQEKPPLTLQYRRRRPSLEHVKTMKT